MVPPEYNSKDVHLELACFVAVSTGDILCRHERQLTVSKNIT
jgi:hypothetical protein